MTETSGNALGLLERQVRSQPDAQALVDGDRSWTFASLAGEVARTAGALAAAGLRPHDRLGVCLKDTADHLIARLAAGRAGIAAVPMDWRQPVGERAQVAAAFRVAAVMTEPRGEFEGTRCIALDPAWRARVVTAPDLPMVNDPDMPLVLLLSSGTTGTPKAAVVTHANFAARLRDGIQACGSLAGQRYLSVNPLYFSGGSHFCLSTLLQGGTVILYPPMFSPEEYVNAVREYGATMAFLVPTVLRWLLALPGDGAPLLPSLKVLIAAAAPLTAEERRLIVKRVSPNLYDWYGSASGGVISVLRPADIDTHASTVGRAVTGVDLQVANDSGQAVPPGTVGLVRLQGPGVATSWFDSGAVATSAERVADGWLYTGDLGVLDAAGYLTLQGRADDVIVRGGAKIYPEIVEAALRRHPDVADAAVVGRPLADGDAQVLAFLIARETMNLQSLMAHCRSVLPGWMQPAEIRVVADFPRTTSGKVRRRDLLSLV